MPRPKTYHPHEGEWFPAAESYRGRWVFSLVCCDCKLTHDVAARLRGKALELAVVRNERSTAARRRKRG